jgi:glycosyltransferase involved in cell wall biosynthesis
MADRPQMTVVIPTCNGARHLAEALRSILAQNGVSLELLISDDRSDDDTLAVVAAVAGDRARIECNTERLGLAGNWNRCLALARAPLVCIFHQDDLMYPGHLAAHAAAFAADPEIGLVASAAEIVDDAGRAGPDRVIERGGLGPADRRFAPGGLSRELAVGNPLRCSAVTLNATAASAAGGFDPSYHYALDWDFWVKVARCRAAAWLARPTVAVRWHPASETHRFKTGTADLDEQVRLLDELYRREADTWPNASALRHAADRRLARAFLSRAHELLKGGDPGLARLCLKAALARSPAIVSTIARDPRLAAQMTVLSLLPGLAARLFHQELGSQRSEASGDSR